MNTLMEQSPYLKDFEMTLEMRILKIAQKFIGLRAFKVGKYATAEIRDSQITNYGKKLHDRGKSELSNAIPLVNIRASHIGFRK